MLYFLSADSGLCAGDDVKYPSVTGVGARVADSNRNNKTKYSPGDTN